MTLISNSVQDTSTQDKKEFKTENDYTMDSKSLLSLYPELEDTFDYDHSIVTQKVII